MSTIRCRNNQAREDQSAVRNIPESKAFRIRITIDKTIVEAKYTAIFWKYSPKAIIDILNHKMISNQANNVSEWKQGNRIKKKCLLILIQWMLQTNYEENNIRRNRNYKNVQTMRMPSHHCTLSKDQLPSAQKKLIRGLKDCWLNRNR